MSFLFVALGGAMGAMGRYMISLIPAKIDYPLLTLITNIMGALLIGFISGYVSNRNVSPNMLLFWKTGVCGGFTTFSTFSLEAYDLIEKKLYIAAGSYMALSVACCIFGVFCGQKLATLIQ